MRFDRHVENGLVRGQLSSPEAPPGEQFAGKSFIRDQVAERLDDVFEIAVGDDAKRIR